MITENNTGFYRVSKVKDKKMKKGYRFVYSSHTQLLDVDIRSKDLWELKKKVEMKGLYWGILNKEKALKSAIEENINPLYLNSSIIDENLLKYKFTKEDEFKYISE